MLRRMARARGSFEDMALEIVRGPTKDFDEAGECWVISFSFDIRFARHMPFLVGVVS